jgi:N-acetylneuraminic acid mutarotase
MTTDYTGWQSLPTARYGVALASFAQNLMAFGGYATSSGPDSATSEVDYMSGYNLGPSTAFWQAAAVLNPPLAFGTAGSDIAFGLVLFVAGGENDGGPVTAVQIWNTSDQFPLFDAGPPLPLALSRGAPVEPTAFHGTGSPFEVWGRQASGALLDGFLSYQSGAFSVTGTPMAAREGAGATLMGGLLYVVGGLNPDGGYSNELDIFDTSSGIWTQGPPMPTARASLTVSADIGQTRLFAIGGYNGQFLGNVEIFLPAENRWAY